MFLFFSCTGFGFCHFLCKKLCYQQRLVNTKNYDIINGMQILNKRATDSASLLYRNHKSYQIWRQLHSASEPSQLEQWTRSHLTDDFYLCFFQTFSNYDVHSLYYFTNQHTCTELLVCMWEKNRAIYLWLPHFFFLRPLTSLIKNLKNPALMFFSNYRLLLVSSIYNNHTFTEHSSIQGCAKTYRILRMKGWSRLFLFQTNYHADRKNNYK